MNAISHGYEAISLSLRPWAVNRRELSVAVVLLFILLSFGLSGIRWLYCKSDGTQEANLIMEIMRLFTK